MNRIAFTMLSLLATVACGDHTGPSPFPSAAGGWLFSGHTLHWVQGTGWVSCLDQGTLTITQQQAAGDSAILSAVMTDWAALCNELNPVGDLAGYVRRDGSVTLAAVDHPDTLRLTGTLVADHVAGDLTTVVGVTGTWSALRVNK